MTIHTEDNAASAQPAFRAQVELFAAEWPTALLWALAPLVMRPHRPVLLRLARLARVPVFAPRSVSSAHAPLDGKAGMLARAVQRLQPEAAASALCQ